MEFNSGFKGLNSYAYTFHDEPHCGHPCYMQGASLVSCWTGKSKGGTKDWFDWETGQSQLLTCRLTAT